MTTERTLSADDRLAQIISGVFHPLLMPFYGLLIIFKTPALYGYLPTQVKKIMFFIILVENILIPVILITYLKFRNIITTWTMDSRKERIMPLIMTSFFYVFTVYLIYRFHIPFFIKSFIICLAVLAVAVTIVSFWYKISIHATGAGALTALVMILSLRMHAPLTILMIIVILASGLVMSSRLWLGSHTPGEVWLGFLLGIFGSGLCLWFF
jgi:membrane-associated phospholipid phosphatase